MSVSWQLFWPALGLLVGTVAGLAVRAVALAGVRRWTRGPALTMLGAAIRIPSLVWSLVFGLYVAIETALDVSHLSPRLHGQLRLVLEAAVILSVTVVLASLVGTLMRRASERQALGGALSGLAQTASRTMVFGVGLLVLLDAVGVQITPILTALGVGGLAVALALQDTLANLFAGIHVLADKPIRVGDYVKLGDSGEGFVIDIGWRSTRVRSLSNTVLIVPNQTVGRASITNYSLPEPRMALSLKISVETSVDPDRIEALLLEEATQTVGHVPGLLGDPMPEVRFIPGFGEYSLDFTLGCHVATFVDQYLVQHELRKRIIRRFRAEGIRMPVPVRAVHLLDGAPSVPQAWARSGSVDAGPLGAGVRHDVEDASTVSAPAPGAAYRHDSDGPHAGGGGRQFQ